MDVCHFETSPLNASAFRKTNPRSQWTQRQFHPAIPQLEECSNKNHTKSKEQEEKTGQITEAKRRLVCLQNKLENNRTKGNSCNNFIEEGVVVANVHSFMLVTLETSQAPITPFPSWAAKVGHDPSAVSPKQPPLQTTVPPADWGSSHSPTAVIKSFLSTGVKTPSTTSTKASSTSNSNLADVADHIFRWCCYVGVTCAC